MEPPRTCVKTPAYRLHKATDQAIAVLNERSIYIGKRGTPASYEKYDRVVAEWLANGRSFKVPDAAPTVNEIIQAYWGLAEGYYRTTARPTSELASIRDSLRIPRQLMLPSVIVPAHSVIFVGFYAPISSTITMHTRTYR